MAFQYATFRVVKGHLLAAKRWHIGSQKVASHNITDYQRVTNVPKNQAFITPLSLFVVTLRLSIMAATKFCHAVD